MSAAAWFEFFFTLPDYRSTIRSSADIITAVLLLVVGVAVSQLAARARRLQVTAITDAGYLAQIHQTVSLTQTARSPDCRCRSRRGAAHRAARSGGLPL